MRGWSTSRVPLSNRVLSLRRRPCTAGRCSKHPTPRIEADGDSVLHGERGRNRQLARDGGAVHFSRRAGGGQRAQLVVLEIGAHTWTLTSAPASLGCWGVRLFAHLVRHSRASCRGSSTGGSVAQLPGRRGRAAGWEPGREMQARWKGKWSRASRLARRGGCRGSCCTQLHTTAEP